MGFTGALMRMNIVGIGGQSIREAWVDGARTYLGVQIPGFPNLFVVGGPHLSAGNFPRATEMQVDFVTGLLEYARQVGHTVVAPDPSAAEGSTNHVAEAATVVLIAETSWFQEANIPGRPKQYLPYAGSLVTFRERLNGLAEEGYPGFDFKHPVTA
jgi:hypothetical protein